MKCLSVDVFCVFFGGEGYCHVDVDNVQHHKLVQFYGV